MASKYFAPRSAPTSQEMLNKYAAPERKIRSNIHFINPNLKNVDLIKSEAYEKPGQKTVFRFWPERVEDDPTQLHQKGVHESAGERYIRGVAISEPVMVADYVGIMPDKSMREKFPRNVKLGQTSFIYAKNMATPVYGVQPRDTPYNVLFWACKNAKDGKKLQSGGIRWEAAWNRLYTTNKHAKMYAGLPSRTQTLQFAVVSLYENGQSFNLTQQKQTKWNSETKENEVTLIDRHGIPYGMGPDDPLVVLQMTASTGLSCLDLAKYGDSYFGKAQPQPGEKVEKPTATFPYGDLLGTYNAENQVLRGGLFFQLYDNRVTTVDVPNTSAANLNMDIVRYSVGVSKKILSPLGEIKATIDPAGLQRILEKQVYFWPASEKPEHRNLDDYLLHIPTIEEQCELLAHAFYPAGNLIQFAWAQYPEYLKFDSVQALTNNRKQFILAQLPEDCTDAVLIGNLFQQTDSTATVAAASQKPVQREVSVRDEPDTDAILASVNPPLAYADDDDDDDELVSSFATPSAVPKAATPAVSSPPFLDDEDELAGSDPDSFDVPDATLNSSLEKARSVNRRFNK